MSVESLFSRERFLPLPFDIQQAALAHEIAHAQCHRVPVIFTDREFGIPLSEEIVADWLACRWGFSVELRKERLISYGTRYCEILEQWPDEQAFIRQMTIWHQRRLAGVAR